MTALPLNIVQDLENALRAAYETAKSANTTRAAAADARRTVLGVVYGTIQQCARKDNAALCVGRLPAEMLVEIFALLPFRDRVSTSHVSHAWREVSLGARALLWSSIPDVRSPHVLTALLERAGPTLPVDISVVRIGPDSVNDFAGTLVEYMGRIRSVSLDFDAEVDTTVFRLRVLAQPAPHLTSFTIMNTENYDDSFEKNDAVHNLFAGHAPMLTTVLWRHAYNFNFQVAFSNVRSFQYSPEFADPDMWSHFFAMLRLETLTIDVSRAKHSPWIRPSDVVLVPPASLKRLLLTTGVWQDHSLYLGTIDHTRIPFIRIDIPLEAGRRPSLVHMLLDHATWTSIEINADYGAFDIRLCDRAGRARQFENLACEPFTEHGLAPSLWMNIGTLTIHRLDLLEGLAFPPLPSLKLLTFVADSDFCHIPEDLRTDRFDVPALVELRIWAYQRMAIERKTMREFLDMAFTSLSNLEVIELRGVELLGDKMDFAFAGVIEYHPPVPENAGWDRDYAV